VNKYKNLFPKTVFVTVSFSLISLWLFFIIENNILSFILALSFAILLLSSLRKFYIKLFNDDIFTEYLYLLLVIPIVFFAFNKIEKKEKAFAKKIFIKNKVNDILDTCNYYEAKLYENNLLFKIKKDNNEYLALKDIKTYSKFELLKHNPKYDYLVPSFIKCPRDSSELVYIFDNEGTLSVILKLKDTDSTRLHNLKFYLEQFQKVIN
jgi:hypothetical protein